MSHPVCAWTTARWALPLPLGRLTLSIEGLGRRDTMVFGARRLEDVVASHTNTVAALQAHGA